MLFRVPVEDLTRQYQQIRWEIAAEYARQVLNLPMFPEMTEEEGEQVAETVRKFFAGVHR